MKVFLVFAVVVVTTSCAPVSPSIPTSTSIPATPSPLPTLVPTVRPVQARPSTPNFTPYPRYVVQNFMNTCIPASGSASACMCLIESLQQRYTLGEFAAIEDRIRRGLRVPDDYYTIADECSP
jgi:hypothetical protein